MNIKRLSIQIMALAVMAIALATTVSINAQTSASVEKTANELVKKYEETAGVDCISVVKAADWRWSR